MRKTTRRITGQEKFNDFDIVWGQPTGCYHTNVIRLITYSLFQSCQKAIENVEPNYGTQIMYKDIH